MLVFMARNKGFLRDVLRLKKWQFYKISLNEFRIDSNQCDKSEVCRGGIDVNKIVGFVTVVETLAIDQPNGYIKINGLAVLPEFQHCGVGKMLMECVEKLASERNISLIGLASGFQRTGAPEFYERLGYQKLSFYFRKRI